MKKIVFLGGYYNFFRFKSKSQGGAEYQTFLLANEFLSHGWSSCFISPGDKDINIKKDNHDIYFLKKRSFLRKFGAPFFLDYFKITKMLNAIQPDIIFSRTGIAWVGIGAKWAKKNNKLMIWSIPSEKCVAKFFLKHERVKSFLFNYMDRKLFEYGINNSGIIMAQAKYQDALLQKNFKRKAELIIPNFHPKPTEKIDKDDQIKVVWVANFKQLKQPEKFINLAYRFKKNDKIKFIMIGRPAKGVWQDKLEKKIKNMKNMEYLKELPIKDVNIILAKSHIFVNTSDYEGFPNTFVQAWMRKTPVVSLNVDPDNLIKKFKLGFHSVTEEQLEKDIKKLIENNELRHKMAENSFKYAMNNHLIDNVFCKIENTIKNYV